MSLFDNTIEFTDVVLKSSLPLNQYLVENSCLSLSLMVNSVPCGETPVVDGNHETGRWEMNIRFHVPPESNSFKLIPIVNTDGLKIPLLAIDYPIVKVLARLKERPDGNQQISLCDPKCPLQLAMICKIRLSSSTPNPPFISIIKEIRTIDASADRKGYARPNAEIGVYQLSSREDLESLYLMASSLSNWDTKATLLSQVGRAYYYKLYQETRQKADLEKAVCIHEEAIQFTSASHPKLADHFGHAGEALKGQFLQNGDPAAIEKAISYYETVLSVIDKNDPTTASHLCNLGSGLTRRFERLGHLVDIDKAITTYEKAVKMTRNGHPDKPLRLDGFGNSLLRRFEYLGNLLDINHAILVHQEAVKIIPDGHPQKQFSLSHLGNSLCRFERLGNLVDVDGAISVQQEAVQITPDGHPGKSSLLNNLGNSFLSRYGRLGSLIDLDSAISVFQSAVKSTPDGHPDKPSVLHNLGSSLMSRFERLGNLVDVENAIPVHQEAVKIIPDGHPGKSSLLRNLGRSLISRFERLGNLIDVENAISLHQEAVKIIRDGHPDKPSLLNSLADSLLHRFGSLTDVESAISVHQEVIKITPYNHPDKPLRLCDLARSLLCRFERLGSLIDIDNAISTHQEAVKIIPDGHPDKPALLDNLGNSFLCRFDRLGNCIDADSAILAHQEATKITPDGRPDKPFRLNNLGNSLFCRFERLGSLIDIDSAIAVSQEAVEMTTDSHPHQPSHLYNLANQLYSRFKRLRNCDDLENALQSYSRAAYSLAGPPMHRFNAARVWAITANENSRSPLPAFRRAIDLLPRIAWLGLKETDQHALLADIGFVVRAAVAAAVEREEYETAVEWAEQGRSIVWQNLLNLRSPIDDLNAVNPKLANRLKDIERQLDSPVSQAFEAGKAPAMPVEDVAQKHSKLATEWDTVVEEIRQIPNFEGFLGTKSFSKLAPAASEGPVVILNVHESRSDALVLIPDESSNFKVSAVNIPLESSVYRLSESLLAGMIGLLSSAGVRSRSIHEHESTQRHMSGDCSSHETLEGLFEDLMGRPSLLRLQSLSRQSEQVQSSESGNFNFSEILGLLWLGVVRPVLDGLAISAESGHLSRVWWCATGALSFLPLHAAGVYGTGGKGHIIADYVVSSYTPTLTAILDQSQPIVRTNFQMLAVAVAKSSFPNAPPIYGTEGEVGLVQILAKANGIQCINLTKESATMKRVVQEMMESNWIHLACHGQQNIKNPMESGFLLHDRILKLSEIVKLSLPKADFAFLSACQTARGDEQIAEESVHLAAGMLLSGCRGVIATMWSINDNDAPKVAEDVYRGMLKDGKPNRKGAAYALHEAVKGLRKSGADFVSWVPFIHIGR